MIMTSVDNIAKTYGGDTILSDISFEIKEKGRVGLVGRNGGGKTTFLRILAGEEKPDSGQIHWKKGITIGYLEQIPDYGETTTKGILKSAFCSLLEMEKQMNHLEHEMAVEEDADKLNGLVLDYGLVQDQFTINGGYEIESSIKTIAQGLNIYSLLDKPFSQLSGGERTKVCLGHMLLQQPDLLLLDEPTNHLDLIAVEWLGTFLQRYKGTVLIISHDRYFLDELFKKIYWIESKEIQCFAGNYTWAKEKMTEQKDKVIQEKKEQNEPMSQKNKGLAVKHMDNEFVEKKLILLEERITKLDEKLLGEQEIAVLQQLYKEKEDLEQQWEEQFKQLEK